MRAAILLSIMITICGLAALFGVPAVHVWGRPVVGVLGLATSLAMAAIPPLVVLAWRRFAGKKGGVSRSDDVPPNTSLERTREG